MNKEILNKLFLLGELHNHRVDSVNDNSIELINEINKIIVKIVSKDEIQVRYNYNEENANAILSGDTIYNFLEDLLTRSKAINVNLKTGELIYIQKWKDELKEFVKEIQESKDYDRYLKHMKVQTKRFEIEYYNGIIVIRDNEKELITYVSELKNALQELSAV